MEKELRSKLEKSKLATNFDEQLETHNREKVCGGRPGRGMRPAPLRARRVVQCASVFREGPTPALVRNAVHTRHLPEISRTQVSAWAGVPWRLSMCISMRLQICITMRPQHVRVVTHVCAHQPHQGSTGGRPCPQAQGLCSQICSPPPKYLYRGNGHVHRVHHLCTMATCTECTDCTQGNGPMQPCVRNALRALSL